MFTRFATVSLIAALLSPLFHLQVFAQAIASKQEQKAAKVKEKIQKLGTGDRSIVKVKRVDGSRVEGSVSQTSDQDFTVIDKAGRSNVIRFDEVDSIGGKNLSTGAKIAIGIGIGAGATLLILYLTFLHITRNN